ncbi:MAG: sulfurtransferase-like selenium metabolism protein YedF [Thermoleophilia bacterium]|nr:sulfurtransferase-like selenium metabolism protein YedF [Thermoleophilia bacterium]
MTGMGFTGGLQRGQAIPATGQIVLAISSDEMGRGDDELGQVLLRSHLHTLSEVTPRPDVLVFFNSGVKLAVEGSPALDDLKALAEQGVQILLCGTCLSHFDLKEKVAVGEISNMYTITETMLRADRVVNL